MVARDPQPRSADHRGRRGDRERGKRIDDADESVFAFELRSGDERWRRSKEIAWVVSLSGADQEVFVATGYRLLSLSTVDGSLRWKRWMRGVVGAPAVGPRSLFVAGYGRTSASAIARLDRTTGEARWTRDVDDFGYTMLTTTPPLANGVLLVGGRYEYGDGSKSASHVRLLRRRCVGGQAIARLPIGLAGMEYFNVAIADGFVVKTEGRLVSAFTVPRDTTSGTSDGPEGGVPDARSRGSSPDGDSTRRVDPAGGASPLSYEWSRTIGTSLADVATDGTGFTVVTGELQVDEYGGFLVAAYSRYGDGALAGQLEADPERARRHHTQGGDELRRRQRLRRRLRLALPVRV